MIDADLIEPVARRLLGEPNRRLSTKTEWRYGARGSLALDLGKGTFFDHELGQGGGVLDLVERETGKTGEDRVQWMVDEGLLPNGDDRRRQGGRGRIVAAYPYHDENGETLFEVVRFEPKDFRQRRPDASRPGGWDWSTRGVRPVPYRLPELTEALGLGKTVFVVEGEKDADRLISLGVPATTNAGGAGKWRPELTEFFAGADVVVIPDNDPQKTQPKTGAPMFHPAGRPILPGQDHAEAVALALMPVARVKLLDLSAVWPDMPPKGDVSDWLDHGGGSADALYDIIERLPHWSPDDQPEPPNGEGNFGESTAREHDKPLPKLTPIRFVKGEVLPPREWIVYDGWIPTRKVTLIQGDGGDGKTSLMQQLQSSCATALAWIGLRVEKCVSIGFYTEEEDRDLKERQAWIDTAYGQHCVSSGNMHLFPRVDEDNELVVFDRSGKPTLTRFYWQVREAALDLHARLVVLDVSVDLYGGDEISRRQVRAFIRPLNRLARETKGLSGINRFDVWG